MPAVDPMFCSFSLTLTCRVLHFSEPSLFGAFERAGGDPQATFSPWGYPLPPPGPPPACSLGATAAAAAVAHGLDYALGRPSGMPNSLLNG